MTEIILAWDNVSEHNASAYLHCNVLLSDVFISHPTSVSARDKQDVPLELYRRLLKIHGVQDIHLHRYKVRVERTKVVSWDKIIVEVELAVIAHSRDHQLIDD